MLFSVLFVLGISLGSIYSKPTEEYLGSPFLQKCFEEAKKIVDDAYKYSREESLKRVRRDVVKPHDALRLLKQPRGDTRSAVRSADYMAQTLRLIHEKVHRVHKRSLNATDLLSEECLNKLANITGCAARIRLPQCHTIPYVNKYRTATGICNNLKRTRLGTANTPFARWLPAEYDDGISQPKGWDRYRKFNGFCLPLVRQVSNNILSVKDANVVSDGELSHLLTFFGQLVDHDLTFTPFSPSIHSFSNGINCDESCEKTEPCIPIPLPDDDPLRRTNTDGCIPTFRSAPVCGTGYSAYNFGGEPHMREQINALSSFLDFGPVYSSDKKLALYLRDLSTDEGLMRVNPYFNDTGRDLLPFHPLQVQMCATRGKITGDPNAEEVPCFIAGDVRVDENIALTALHTLFLREHNRVARHLKRINPHWDGEIIYQETRKILGAYIQVLVYRDYLPLILGEDVMHRLDKYEGYDPHVDPSIANVFATAAFRFSHLTIQPVLLRRNQEYEEDPRFLSVPLFKAFFTPWRIVFEGGIAPLLRGLMFQPAKLNIPHHMMVDALRERLFQFVQHLALDLGSLNMQRGRDHGLPGYNAWRRFCGLPQPRNLAQLARVLNNIKLARKLLELYGTPDNIDVWMAAAAEPFVQGGRVGQTFACLIAFQFHKIRQGDRFWYQNRGVFTKKQRTALSNVSLSRIICDNTDIEYVSENPFLAISAKNRLVPCSSIPQLDLRPWKERDSEGSSGFDACS